MRRLQDIQRLVDYGQCLPDAESTEALAWLKSERSRLREFLKTQRNAQFGSIFRTHTHRTLYVAWVDITSVLLQSFYG